MVVLGCLGEKTISKGQYKDLEMVMGLEKTTFEKGEKVYITLTLTNKGDDIITLNVIGSDIGVYSLDGSQVAYVEQRRGEKTVNLGPGVSVFDYFDWYQTYRDSDGVYTEIDPGKYYIVEYLNADKYKDSKGEYIVGSDDIRTEPLTIMIK